MSITEKEIEKVIEDFEIESSSDEIDDNLYTVSEDYIKVNSLDGLQEISQLKIKEDY